MEYQVKPDAEFQKLHVGDKIDATVVVTVMVDTPAPTASSAPAAGALPVSTMIIFGLLVVLGLAVVIGGMALMRPRE